MIGNLFDQVAEIWQRQVSGVSPLGNDLTTAASQGTWPCYIEQSAQTEQLDDRTQNTTTHRVWFGPAAPIRGADYFTVDGERYELDGEPQEWRNPLTKVLHHLECVARRVTDGDPI